MERPRCFIVNNESKFSFDLRSSLKDSDYTLNHYRELTQTPIINLNEVNESIKFNEKAIHEFIKYLETSEIPQIDNETIFTFNKLSRKFQTKTFQTFVDKYINENKGILLPIIFNKT